MARIARPRAGYALTPLQARGRITRETPGDYHLALELERNGEFREARFDSPSCAPLRKAASLVLALAFGDGVDLQADAPSPSPETIDSTPPAASTTPGWPRERDVVTPSREPGPRRLRWLPWAGAVGSSGFIGSAAFGAEVGLGLGGHYWSSFARGSAFSPGSAATRDGVSAELSAITGAVGVCASAPLSALRMDGCVGFELGAVRAHSSGAARDGSATVPWYAFSPSIAALVPIAPPFGLRAELALLLPLQTPRYDIEPLGTLYGAARAVPRAALGLAVAL